MCDRQSSNGRRVLLVGDDAQATRRLVVALSDIADFCTADCRADALIMARTQQPDVVIIDHRLPDIEGPAICSALLADAATADAVVLLIVERDDAETARRALEVGATAVFCRPPDMPVLKDTMVTSLARRDATQCLYGAMPGLQRALETLGDGMLATDAAGIVRHVNRPALAMLGIGDADVTGQPAWAVMRLRDAGSGCVQANPVHRALADVPCPPPGIEGVLTRTDGSEVGIVYAAAPIRGAGGLVTGSVILFKDVTESRALASQMTRLAQYDVLTDLPNRALLADRIAQAIQNARRSGSRVGLLLLDLDQFKYVNDTLGHAVGDGLLKQVALRLTQALRATDTTSRLGGDEFVVLLPQIGGADHVTQVVDKLLASLTQPFDVDGVQVRSTFSMGISLYPDDGLDHDTLLKHADAAMYRAKSEGRNRYQFYRAEIGELMLARHALERHMREALEQGHFTLHYQPQVTIGPRRVVGVEALVRWCREDGTLVPPAQFIPLAEECGLIVPLGMHVLREACQQARRWLENGIPPLRVAVNISAAQLAEKDFAITVRQALTASRLSPRHLELEITEGVMLADAEHTRAVLEDLRRDGISIAIDDFGTGYSSLAYLKHFPVDVLKIDRTFVQDALSDSSGAAIVSAIVAMGRSLGLDLVAEGVESDEQAIFLRSLGCRVMQGYLYSRPRSVEDITDFLQRWPAADPAIPIADDQTTPRSFDLTPGVEKPSR